MNTKLTNYLGEGFSIHTPLKLNDELLRYVQQAVLDLKYQNAQLYIRDLIYGHNKGLIFQELLKNSAGNPQEPLDNQGVPVMPKISTETFVKQVELSTIPHNSISELAQLRQLNANSISELAQLKQLNANSKAELAQFKQLNDKELDQLRQLNANSISELAQLRQLNDNSISELAQLKDNSEIDMSQVEIEDSFIPEGISSTQYRMYVRRLEDENVKLESALKICHNALESKQQDGNLSAMLYQSELAIHQVISWVHYYFQQFFPKGDIRQILTDDVKKFHPNFPYFKLPNQ